MLEVQEFVENQRPEKCLGAFLPLRPSDQTPITGEEGLTINNAPSKSPRLGDWPEFVDFTGINLYYPFRLLGFGKSRTAYLAKRPDGGLCVIKVRNVSRAGYESTYNPETNLEESKVLSAIDDKRKTFFPVHGVVALTPKILGSDYNNAKFLIQSLSEGEVDPDGSHTLTLPQSLDVMLQVVNLMHLCLELDEPFTFQDFQAKNMYVTRDAEGKVTVTYIDFDVVRRFDPSADNIVAKPYPNADVFPDLLSKIKSWHAKDSYCFDYLASRPSSIEQMSTSLGFLLELWNKDLANLSSEIERLVNLEFSEEVYDKLLCCWAVVNDIRDGAINSNNLDLVGKSESLREKLAVVTRGGRGYDYVRMALRFINNSDAPDERLSEFSESEYRGILHRLREVANSIDCASLSADARRILVALCENSLSDPRSANELFLEHSWLASLLTKANLYSPFDMEIRYGLKLQSFFSSDSSDPCKLPPVYPVYKWAIDLIETYDEKLRLYLADVAFRRLCKYFTSSEGSIPFSSFSDLFSGYVAIQLAAHNKPPDNCDTFLNFIKAEIENRLPEKKGLPLIYRFISDFSESIRKKFATSSIEGDVPELIEYFTRQLSALLLDLGFSSSAANDQAEAGFRFEPFVLSKVDMYQRDLMGVAGLNDSAVFVIQGHADKAAYDESWLAQLAKIRLRLADKFTVESGYYFHDYLKAGIPQEILVTLVYLSCALDSNNLPTMLYHFYALSLFDPKMIKNDDHREFYQNIMHSIKEKLPQWCVLENIPLSDKVTSIT